MGLMGFEGFFLEVLFLIFFFVDGWDFDLGVWSIMIWEGLIVKIFLGLSMMFGFCIYKIKVDI